MDPVTVSTIVGAILAAAPVVWKALGKASSLVFNELRDLREQLHADHMANTVRVEALQEDITDIKVDVAVVKAKVDSNHEYTQIRLNRMED